MFAGVLALLKNIGVPIDWNLIWPIALIFVGFAVKHMGHGKMCGHGMGMSRWGDRGMCKGGVCGEMECESGKCEGGECAECKK